MAFEQETQYRTTLEENLRKLNELDADSLARKELGPGLDTVPYQTLNNLSQRAAVALEQFSRIKEFSLEKYPNNPIDQRNSFGDQITSVYPED